MTDFRFAATKHHLIIGARGDERRLRPRRPVMIARQARDAMAADTIKPGDG
jgi:hypothetical protein